MKYILAFLIFYTLGAQAYNSSLIQNDSTSFVNKATDGIPKMLYAFMEDYKSTVENFGEGKIKEKEENGMSLFKLKFLDNNKNFNNSTDLFDGIDSFLANKENGWNSNGLRVFQALRENYKGEISSTSYNLKSVIDIGDKTKINIDHNQNKNAKIYWNEASNKFFLTEAKLAYADEKKNQLISVGTDQDNRSNLRERVVTPSENNYSYVYDYLGYFGVFVFGFLCAIMYFNYKIRKLIGKKFNDYKRLYKNDYGGFSIIRFDVLKILKDKKEDYQDKAESNQIPITKIQSGNNIQGSRLKELENSQQQNITHHSTDEPYLEEKSPTTNWNIDSSQELFRSSSNEKKINILYFSAPDQSGSFSLENSSITATSRSYYKIEYVDEENIGKLIYRSGKLDMSALSQMDFILSPVCDIENSSMTNPSIINIESDGMVIKEDNSWRIQQKIKIKLS